MMKIAAFTVALAIFTAGCTSTTPASAPAKETSGVGSIVRLDPAFDALVPQDARIDKLAGGFEFTEAPVWRPQEPHLWFSDVMANVVRQWSPDGKATIALQYAGADSEATPGALIGPNGEIADKDGAVLICQHGNRRIVRVSKDGKLLPGRAVRPNRMTTQPKNAFQRSVPIVQWETAGRDSGFDAAQRDRILTRSENLVYREFG